MTKCLTQQVVMLRLHFDDLTQQVVMLRLHFDWLSLLLVGKHRVSHFFGLEIAKVLEVVLLFIFFAFTLVESLFDFLSFVFNFLSFWF
jgi:hypothetical protein